MEILRVEGLTKTYSKGGLFGPRSTVRAADGVTFAVGSGEVFVLAGESGSGKSTIARMILRSIEPDSGTVYIDGMPGTADAVRSACQMVHQDPYDSINPRMRVADIVAEPLEAAGMGAQERRARALEALSEVRLDPAEVASKHPHMLSGGQRQRVVLARALAPRPRVIIADEPVSMLDVSIRAEMLELLGELQGRGIAFVYITHDLATARHFGDMIGVLYRGRIVESGPIGEVLGTPRHPYTQALVSAVPDPDPANAGRQRAVRISDGPTYPGGCAFAPRCPHATGQCATDPPLAGIGGGRSTACHVNPGWP